VSQADRDAVAEANAQFALDLYHQAASQPGNLFYSPYSISLALAMTYAGAREQTAQQMAQVLHFTLPPERLHPAFNALDLALMSQVNSQQAQPATRFQLNIVNAIWGQQGYTFLPGFLDVLAENYGAGLRLLDFQQAPEPSRVAINDWVASQTNDRIRDLIPQGKITGNTRFVLTNAIYFLAQWLHQFDPKLTQPGPFHRLDGTDVTAPLMTQTEMFEYAEGVDYQAVLLPYEGETFSMLIVLPKPGHWAAFEAGLQAAQVAAALEALELQRVAVTLPRFEFTTSLDLSQTLAAMGMTDAFDPGAADFSGMDGTRNLLLSAVLHKAFVSVDEEGTEAAAATAVIGGVTGFPQEPVTMRVDRPFLFCIAENETRAILFAGRVVDPQE
jgi:serpin B